MIVPLSRAYAARGGNPVVERVDRRIFSLTYFHECMACTFCHDSCCQHGATVELPLVEKLAALADQLEPFVDVPRDRWYGGNEMWDDPDFPGGWFTRTDTRATPLGPRCVFANSRGRGCALHTFALERGLPVHDVKPMACNLFPVLGTARYRPIEINDGTLICRDVGIACQSAERLGYYFAPTCRRTDTTSTRRWPGPPRARGAVWPGLAEAACGEVFKTFSTRPAQRRIVGNA